MQKKLMKIVKDMREDGLDLMETPVIFKWSYKEDPYIEYELLIKETEQSNIVFSSLDESVTH